ncbi:DUF6152 family protein [Elongatibacter sediminis]|uniref:DUF6152 family protein n=1 Tax=Elongatibacter sediminis TaxID=3119006 RepID=A0AAW9RL79_9GAMM
MVLTRFNHPVPEALQHVRSSHAHKPRYGRTAIALLLLVFFVWALPQGARAHHSVSQFDQSKEVVLTGVVASLEWANPHVWIRVNVTGEDGEEVEWGVEASNPLDLSRKGWSKKTFQAGDEVAITIYPARNGKPFGAFVKAEMPDGKTLEGP